MVFDQVIDCIRTSDDSLAAPLSEVLTLYGIHCIEKDLGFFLSTGILTPAQGRQVVAVSRQYCTIIASQAIGLVDAFGLPDHCVTAPIAADWVKYNETDNQGELITT